MAIIKGLDFEEDQMIGASLIVALGGIFTILTIISFHLATISHHYRYIWFGIIFLVVVFVCWINTMKYAGIIALIFAAAGFIEIGFGYYVFAVILLLFAGAAFFIPALKEDEDSDEFRSLGNPKDVCYKKDFIPAVEHSVEDDFIWDRRYGYP